MYGFKNSVTFVFKVGNGSSDTFRLLVLSFGNKKTSHNKLVNCAWSIPSPTFMVFKVGNGIGRTIFKLLVLGLGNKKAV